MYLTCFMQSSFYLLFLLDHHLYLLFLFYAFLFLLKFLFPFLRYFLHSFIFIFDLLSDFFHITFTFFFCVKHYTIAFILLKLIFICLPLSLTLPFSFFLTHNHSLFSFISLHRLLLLLVSSIILGSLLTLSSFTRFSLYCLHPASRIFLPILTLLPPSLSPYLLPRPLNSLSFSLSLSVSLFLPSQILLTRYLKLYFRPSLRYRINPSLLPTIFFSFYFDRQRQNKPLPTEGMNENRLVEAIIGRARVQEARGGKPRRGGGQHCYST